ncbi:MAG TPA: ABC transporter substrate-binding protein, partial [Polyangiaceae bacterium]
MSRIRPIVAGRALGLALAALTLGACTNNPYPEQHDQQKVLYFEFDEAPKTLDPAVAYTTSAHEIIGKVCDTLLEYHYLKRPYELIPGLANKVPAAETLPDGRVSYLFELRDDLLFQKDPCFAVSGAEPRRVVAQDVEFELMRVADPAVNSPVIEPFSNLAGFREFSSKLLELRKTPGFAKLGAREQYERVGPLSGARAVDRLRLRLTLDHPYPQILYWFAMPFTTPVPWEAVQYYDGKQGRDHLADHPVGSGPFALEVYDKQSRIVLGRNPNWYGVRHPEWKAPGATYPSQGEPSDEKAGRLDPSVVGKPLPFSERIEYRREKERIPAFNKFLQGYYDASGILRESFDKVIREDRLSPEMSALGMQLDKSVIPAVYYIGFNMEDPLVGAKGGDSARKLRQAMSLVVDAKEYCRLFLNGRGVPAHSVLAPGIYGYDENYRNPFRVVDVSKA